MRSLRDCESHPHRGESTHPLSSPTCSEVGESHGFCVEQFYYIFLRARPQERCLAT